TDRFYAAWNGEWSRFANLTGSLIPMNHDTSKIVYVPEGASEMQVTLTYDPWQTDENAIASLYVVIDTNGDGSVDWRQSGPALADARLDTISLAGMPTGQNWVVNVEGSGISWQLGDRFRESQFREVRSEFTISLNLTFPAGDFIIPIQDPHAQAATWQPLPGMATGTRVNITRYAYDLGEITSFEEEGGGDEEEGGTNWFLIFLLLAAVGVGAFFGGRYYNKKKEQQVITGVKVDGEKP
ncbi:MAG: hypothetical protein KAH57_09210, partial [Thermoplasmata archaeon]|nr:hypothetical protein [Thermoplasmata archaeon]